MADDDKPGFHIETDVAKNIAHMNSPEEKERWRWFDEGELLFNRFGIQYVRFRENRGWCVTLPQTKGPLCACFGGAVVSYMTSRPWSLSLCLLGVLPAFFVAIRPNYFRVIRKDD